MPINIPPAVNYQSPLNAVPTFFAQEPREGRKMIGCEIDWGVMGGDNNCVNLNLQNNATLEFSQIVTLSIDNSLCGADIEFIFPDTTESLSIPAYAPKCIVPVFTNQTQFFCWAPGAIAGDVTRFSIHNSMPPPVTVPFTVEQQVLTNSNITADGSATVALLGASVNGTLEAIQIMRNGPVTTGGTQNYSIADGSGNLTINGQFSSQNTTVNFVMLDLNPMHVRFTGGLNFMQSGANMGGKWVVNGLFRTP
jgi:hypothetical protein